MGLVEDFATWTEKTRRKLSRESGSEGREIAGFLPVGVPVEMPEALEWIDGLLRLNPPSEIAEKAERWRQKLQQQRAVL